MTHDKDDIFVEGKEKVIGYVSTDSGSIIVADGIVEGDINTPLDRRVSIDLHAENTRFPLVATKQNGRRFLLIPVDAGEAIPSAKGEASKDQVTMLDEIPVPNESKSTNDTEPK